MSPQGVPTSARPHNPSPTSARHGPALPPIVPPHEVTRRMNDPQSAVSTSLPSLSREGSISSIDGPNKMHHILNPAAGSEPGSKPPTPDSGARHALPPISVSRSSSGERLTPMHSPYGPAPPPRPAHLLSAPTLASPTGTIDAVKSPFLPVSGSGPPMTGAPPAPTSQPYVGKPGYPFPQQGLPPRRSSDTMSAHGSRTGSPTPSYSSHGQPSTAQGSPRSQFSSVAQYGPQALYHGPGTPHGGPMQQTAPSPEHLHHTQGQYPPPHHHAMLQRGAPYHMILNTDQGPIQVPMDINTASKLADEKRKRNAGASARFRQRRKEKEKESATTISKLEDRVRDMREEKEFYKAERDYYKDLVYKHEGARAMLVPRGPSPSALSDRNRQGSLSSSREGGRSPSSGGAAEYQESGDRGSDDGRIVRRRISGYEPEQRAISQQQTSTQQQQHQPEGHQHPHHQQSSSQHPMSGPSPHHANHHHPYHRPDPDSRGAPGPASHAAHGSAPQTMRTGPYEANSHPHHVYHEMRWVAPS